MVCAVGTVKGQGNTKELFSADFSSSEWAQYSTSKSIASGTEINGMYFKCASSVVSNQLVIEGNNMKTSNYWISIPVKGIKGKFTVTFNVDPKTTNLRISVVEGSNYQSNYTAHQDISASNNEIVYEYNMTGGGTEAVIYFGRTGSSRNKINSITVSTQNDKELKTEEITNATINEVQISKENLSILTTTQELVLEEPKYQTTPTVVFTKTRTFTDGSTENVDEPTTVTESADYFIANTTIGEKVYTLKLARDKSVKSSDATLKSLSVDNEPIKDFNAETLSYNIELPFGTTDIPTITAEATSSVATVSVIQATTLPGTATVNVTAEDGTTVMSYTVNFTVAKGSSEKELKQAMFSNGFDGFIKGNTIEAYYMEGTEVPTLNATVSDKATATVNDNTLTITAEDGTTAEYTIILEPVSPYTGLGRVFDGTETDWIKTGYSFDAETNRGWKFSKNHDKNTPSDLSRIIDGRNRLYFFVDACNDVTLKTATGISNARKIKVYVNGKEISGVTEAPKYSAGAGINIECGSSSPCMIAIVSNQDGGDGGFGEIVVNKPAPTSITLNSYGYNTYSNANTVTVEGAVAYTCTVNKETSKAVLKELGTVIPAGQGVLLKGENGGTVTFAFGGEEPVIEQNDFQPVLKETATPTDKAIYVLNGNQFKKYIGATLVANKAYIELGSATEAKALSIEFGGGTTDIDGITTADVDDNAPVYNLNGQRVNRNTKGIVISNGKKIINK